MDRRVSAQDDPVAALSVQDDPIVVYPYQDDPVSNPLKKNQSKEPEALAFPSFFNSSH